MASAFKTEQMVRHLNSEEGRKEPSQAIHHMRDQEATLSKYRSAVFALQKVIEEGKAIIQHQEEELAALRKERDTWEALPEVRAKKAEKLKKELEKTQQELDRLDRMETGA